MSLTDDDWERLEKTITDRFAPPRAPQWKAWALFAITLGGFSWAAGTYLFVTDKAFAKTVYELKGETQQLKNDTKDWIREAMAETIKEADQRYERKQP